MLNAVGAGNERSISRGTSSGSASSAGSGGAIFSACAACSGCSVSSSAWSAVTSSSSSPMCGVVMRQGDTHTFIAFYIIYFHLVSVLLHSCCITLISLSTCSFTDVGNTT